MRKKLLDLMQGRFGILWCMAVLLSAMFPAKALLAGQEQMDCPPLAGAQGVDKCSLSEARPTEICTLLTNKTASEKAQIKSRQIAKRDFKGEYTNTQYGVRVEIIGEVKEININGQSGIELFAKAWRGGKQLGFGKDGSVEIERFRIFNPPVLVDDPNGDIVREWTDSETGELKQRKLRENPQEAIRQSLAHTIKIVGKDNNSITVGKVGNTTSTFYSNAGAVSPCDGHVYYSSYNNTWAFHHDAANGNTVDVMDTDFYVGNIRTGGDYNGTWEYFIRFIANFDTSSIPDTDNITSATFSFTARTKRNPNGAWSADVVDAIITGVSPTTTDNIVNGDYDAFGSTLFCRVVFADVVTNSSTYNDAPLNSSGLSYISKTGVTSLGFRAKADFDNVEPAAAGTSQSGDIIGLSADTAGTSKDPKLVVVHSAPTLTPTPTPTDTTAPSGSVSINSGASYTNTTTVTLNLSATDSRGVTGYYLSDSSTTPSSSASGWTSVTSTTSYSATVSYSLSSGEGSKTIYAWYKDAAGNVSSTASATITLDTTVPTVTISSPTSSSTYTATSSTISLGGSASDSSSGISSVTWSNNRGGNGTATGTASWTVSSISLSTGDNVITVTAKDGANNSGTDTVQVTYGTPTTVSAPTVSTGSASSVTTSSATLNGTVNANGGTTTAWFQYGTTSGSYGNTSSTQTVTGSSNTAVSIGISGLSFGTTYYYRIAASNSGGTSYGSEASFTTSTSTATPTPTPSTGDTTAPTITITTQRPVPPIQRAVPLP